MAKSLKKKLTLSEEFDILKLVLDKFLWLSMFFMIYGLWKILEQNDFTTSIFSFVVSLVILMLFMFVILKEYEISK